MSTAQQAGHMCASDPTVDVQQVRRKSLLLGGHPHMPLSEASNLYAVLRRIVLKDVSLLTSGQVLFRLPDIHRTTHVDTIFVRLEASCTDAVDC